MNGVEKIVRLCDRWWAELSHSKSETMKPVALEWLDHLGWSAQEPIFLEGAACGFIETSVTGQRIVFYFTMPGELDTPSFMIEKGLDYCESTLMLVGEAQLEKHDYAVITDLNRTYVYDAQTDDLILHSDSPTIFVQNVMPELLKENVDLGALEEVRRSPASYIARQLRVWLQRWVTVLSREPYGSEAVANSIMDRILVMRFLYDHSICESAGWSYKMQFTHVISAAYEESPASARRSLLRLMDDLHRIWHNDMFAQDDSVRRIVTRSVIVVEMIQELALVSKSKFSEASILESFNFGEASEKARVRLVPEHSEEREAWLGLLSISHFGNSKMELDILEEGYRAIPHWFDRLLNTVARISREHDLTSMVSENAVDAPDFAESGELDLFSWTEESSSEKRESQQTKVDLIDVSLGRLFLVWAATERQHRTARIVLLLHIIKLYESDRFAFGVFPEMDTAIADRPALLESDKQWIYQGGSNPTEGWDVI